MCYSVDIDAKTMSFIVIYIGFIAQLVEQCTSNAEVMVWRNPSHDNGALLTHHKLLEETRNNKVKQ